MAAALLAVFSCVTPTSYCTAKENDIQAIDFRNYAFPWNGLPHDTPMTWHWIASTPRSRVKLTNGVHRFTRLHQPELLREHAPMLSFDFVTYGDLDGDGIDEAAVAINYSTGGTANWDYLYIYKFVGKSVRLLARLESGSRAAGGLIKAAIKDGVLVLDFYDFKRRIGDCCSDGFIRVRYRWIKGRFIEEGPREQGDL